MASWPLLSQKINYLLASQSIVWYLLREITDIDTSNYHRYRHRYQYQYWYWSISNINYKPNLHMYICTVSLEVIIMQFQPLKQYHGIRSRSITYTNRWEWYTTIHASKPLKYQLCSIILLYVPKYGLTLWCQQNYFVELLFDRSE